MRVRVRFRVRVRVRVRALAKPRASVRFSLGLELWQILVLSLG